MSPNLSVISDGKKFMWDGQVYESQEAASRVAQAYHDEDFQIRTVEEGGFLLYTRRTAKEVATTY